MNTEYTPSKFVSLLETPSTASFEAVFDAMHHITGEPLSWRPPCGEAEYLTELLIGDIRNPKKVVIAFSRHANLSFAYIPPIPLVSISIIEDALNRCGWILLSRDEVLIVLDPFYKKTVHDQFFNCV